MIAQEYAQKKKDAQENIHAYPVGFYSFGWHASHISVLYVMTWGRGGQRALLIASFPNRQVGSPFKPSVKLSAVTLAPPV